MNAEEMARRLHALADMLERGAVTTRSIDHSEATERDSAGRTVTTVTIRIVFHPHDRQESET